MLSYSLLINNKRIYICISFCIAIDIQHYQFLHYIFGRMLWLGLFAGQIYRYDVLPFCP